MRLSGWRGSNRIWWYMSAAVRWHRLMAVDGWPLPALVVIWTASLARWTALVLIASA